MNKIMPAELIERELRNLTLPSLIRPPVGPKDDPTEELVLWGINYYVYSVLAHLRSILGGIVQLAQANNVPAAYILCRHVFEWTAQSCYMSRNLKNYVERKEWKRAWSLQSIVANGSLWLKRYGTKYAPPEFVEGIPDPLTVANVVGAYGRYLHQQGKSEDEAQDTYGILSEHSHPNSVCFISYHRFVGREVRFTVPGPREHLPVVNWCLIDLMLFLQDMLILSREKVVRRQVVNILHEVAKLAPSVEGES
jgi:hypothetical protein